MNSFIINLINTYIIQSCYWAVLYRWKKIHCLSLKELLRNVGRQKDTWNYSSYGSFGCEKTEFKVTLVKNDVYCKDTEFSQNQRTQSEHLEDGEEQKQLAATSLSLSWATDSPFLSASCQLYFPFSEEQLPPFTHQPIHGGHYFQFTGPPHHQLSTILCFMSSSRQNLFSLAHLLVQHKVRFLANKLIGYFWVKQSSLVQFRLRCVHVCMCAHAHFFFPVGVAQSGVSLWSYWWGWLCGMLLLQQYSYNDPRGCLTDVDKDIPVVSMHWKQRRRGRGEMEWNLGK